MAGLIPTTIGSLQLGELERTFGVLFVGYVVTMVLYGFTFFHTSVYYSRYPRDPLAIRSIVALLCALDTTICGLISRALYYYLVSLFPFTQGLTDATITFCVQTILSVLAIYIAQAFFAYRVWTLSKSYLVSGLVSVSATVAFVLGLIMSIQMFQNRLFIHLAEDEYKAIAASYQGITCLTGIFTFLALSFYLRPAQNPGLKPVSGYFDHIVAFGITRGGVATIIQFGWFIVFISNPSQVYWIPFQLVAEKVFVHSILTMLNSREVFRGQGVNEEDSVSSRSGGGTMFSTVGPRTTNTGVRFNVLDTKTAPAINIEVSRSVIRDNVGKDGYDFDDSNSADETIGNKKPSLAA